MIFHCEGALKWFALVLLAAPMAATSLRAQYVPGQTYFGRSNYIEYIAGDLPIIISAPHGGSLMPSEIPNRTYGTFATDTNTDDLARKIRTEIQNQTGHVPHIIICRLDRDKIDCNRDIVEGAQGNVHAEQAWNEFQNFIIYAKTNAVALHGRGFYIDLHGHGHTAQRLELGYLLSSTQLGFSDATLNGSTTYRNQSSIRTLAQQSALPFATLLRGANSFGGMMENEGYPSVPSSVTPHPDGDPYFNGGYNTHEHGSVNGGMISGLQIESNYTGVRDTSANRTSFGQSLARILESYLAQHYTIDLRTCVPSVWDSGTGNFATALSWATGVLPVSSNYIVFAGGGGTARNNLSALSTGTGFVGSISFSNTVAGNYILSSNAFTLLGGVTNNSAFSHVVSNNLTLAKSVVFAANSNSLTFGGVITNSVGVLTFNGGSNHTVSGFITGIGSISKNGAGTLTYSNPNNYTGNTTLSAGTLQLSATSTPGDGGGTLNLLGGVLALSATRDPTTGVIPNPIVLAGNCVIQNTPGAGSGTRNFPFGSDAILSASGSLTIRNIATANVNTMNLRLQGSGFEFSRPIIFDNSLAADPLNNSVQLDCYNTNGTQIFSGVISGAGRIRRGSLVSGVGGTTILTGANTYSGGTTVNDGTLIINNTSGSGTGSGNVVIAGGVVSGTGTIGGAITTENLIAAHGVVSPGMSAGTLTAGGLNLNFNGTYLWELSSLTTNGAGTNFDQIILSGGTLALGGTSKLELCFIDSATAPNLTNLFWEGIRKWRIITLTAGAANPDLTRFASISNAVFPAGTFTNSIDTNGNIWLTFTPTGAFAPPLIDPTVVGANTTNVTVTWNGIDGQNYEVQYKDSLSATNWNFLGAFTATNSNTSFIDTTGPAPHRFYRVVIP